MVRSGNMNSPPVSSTEEPVVWAFFLDADGMGIIYAFLSVVIAVPYVLILHVLRCQEAKFRGVTYAVMFHLGISDMLWLCSNASSAVFSIGGTTFSYWVNKVCGALVYSSFMPLIVQTFLLAIDRYMIICMVPQKRLLLEQLKIIKIGLIFSWLFGAVSLAFYLSPLCSFMYVVEVGNFLHDDSPGNNISSNTQFGTSVISLAASFVLYVAVIMKLGTFTKDAAPVTLHMTARQRRHEVRIFIQASVITIYIGFCTILWYAVVPFFPESHLINFTINTTAIGMSGVNPLLYLIFNGQLKEECLKVLGIKRRSKVNVSKVLELRRIATTTTAFF